MTDAADDDDDDDDVSVWLAGVVAAVAACIRDSVTVTVSAAPTVTESDVHVGVSMLLLLLLPLLLLPSLLLPDSFHFHSHAILASMAFFILYSYMTVSILLSVAANLTASRSSSQSFPN